MPIEVLVLLGLILLNGVFAMSEIALVTARKGRLQALAADGDRGARAALQLNEEPTRFLSTVQVGITSIGVLSASSARRPSPSR
jgi:putative hemolysin